VSTKIQCLIQICYEFNDDMVLKIILSRSCFSFFAARFLPACQFPYIVLSVGKQE